MNTKFIKHIKKGVVYFTFEHFDQTNLVTHCFTSRIGGVSEGAYGHMNLGYKSGDKLDHIEMNHRIMKEVLGIEEKDFVFTEQVHKTEIYTVKGDFDSKVNQMEIRNVDGFVTNDGDYALHTVYADCVPIYILDIENHAIGLAHSGWRGTVGKMGEVLLQRMASEFGTEPSNCLAGIGPSIGPCCFEVGKEVTDSFKKVFNETESYLVKEQATKDYINLWKINKKILVDSGVSENNIICAEMCTSCNSEYFYSYRRDNGRTGRMAGIMKLKND